MLYKKDVAFFYSDRDLFSLAKPHFNSRGIGLHGCEVTGLNPKQISGYLSSFSRPPEIDLVVIDDVVDSSLSIIKQIKENSSFSGKTLIYPVNYSPNLYLGAVVRRSGSDFALRTGESSVFAIAADAILNGKPIPPTLYFDPDKYKLGVDGRLLSLI